MMILIYLTIMISFLSMLIIKLSILISYKMKLNLEKMSPFECGFNPMSTLRLPFSMRFFLITIIFLIFDVEIALLIPMIYNMNFSSLAYWSMTSIIFLLILLMGLFHEWNQGALNWL